MNISGYKARLVFLSAAQQRSSRRHGLRQKGVAMIEFALVLPLLLLLIFGSIDFGILLYNKAVLTNASREGARAGVVYVESRTEAAENAVIDSTITAYCQNNLITFGTANAPVVTKSRPSGRDSGDPLTVAVSYTYQGVVVGGFIAALNGALTFASRTTMNYE